MGNCASVTLTKHFKERWMERVGGWPTVEAVSHYIEHSVQTQRCQNLFRKNGNPFRVLASYWHPDLDIVIKVDTYNQTAVTVISRENWIHRPRHREVPVNVPGAAPAGSRAWTGAVKPSWMADRVALIKARFGRKSDGVRLGLSGPFKTVQSTRR